MFHALGCVQDNVELAVNWMGQRSPLVQWAAHLQWTNVMREWPVSLSLSISVVEQEKGMRPQHAKIQGMCPFQQPELGTVAELSLVSICTIMYFQLIACCLTSLAHGIAQQQHGGTNSPVCQESPRPRVQARNGYSEADQPEADPQPSAAARASSIRGGKCVSKKPEL